MISIVRHQDCSNPQLPALTIYTMPALIPVEKLEPFEELHNVITTVRDDIEYIDILKDAVFFLPQETISTIIKDRFHLKSIQTTIDWIRHGKTFWHIGRGKTGELRAIQIPGLEPNPFHSTTHWEDYGAFIYQTIGGEWTKLVTF